MARQNAAATTAALALLAVSIIAAGTAYAQEHGMSVTASAEDGGDTIVLTGRTSVQNDVTVLVEAPNKNLIFVGQVSPDQNGEFGTDIRISDGLWKQDGFYKIIAQQGGPNLFSLPVKVQVAGGATLATDVTQSTFENTMIAPADTTPEPTGLEMRADAEIGSTMISITGSTDKRQVPITITVDAPNGNFIAAEQTSPRSDGSFSADIMVGCPTWEQDGFYTITAQQDDDPLYAGTAQIDIGDCVVVPEFGAVAVLVLAAAIVSIIAVSARSRLGIMARY